MRNWLLGAAFALLLSVDGWGCSAPDTGGLNLMPGLCLFRSGIVNIHLFDPGNVYPDIDQATFSADDGALMCTQTVSYSNGVGLRMACADDAPVHFCTLKGACMDAATETLYRCEGTVDFE